MVSAVIAVAIAIRLAPLHWTAYPFNPDAFSFARYARDTLAAGTISGETTPHGLSFTVTVAMVAELSGIDPLRVGQPIVALIGAGPAVLAVAFTRRLGYSRGWSARAVFVAASLAGLGLATQGVYLRRTAGVHYETFGLLLVPVLAFAAHWLFATRRLAWGVIVSFVLMIFPVTHHFSTVIGGVALVFIAVLWCRRRLTWGTLALATGLVGGFWLYLGTYYALTRPAQVENVTMNPGLFLAWVVFGTALYLWFNRASARAGQIAVGSVLASGFLILVLNSLGLYPGTSATPSTLLLFLLPLAGIAVLTAIGVGSMATDHDVGPVVLVLLVAPITIVFFGLSSGVTPGNTLIARRGQTFVHLVGMVLAALGAVSIARPIGQWSERYGWRTGLRVAVPMLMLVSALVTAPVAFADLDVFSYQGTTTSEEFQGATFAVEHAGESWAGDDHLTRIASNYYGDNSSGHVAPVYGWLHGEPPPTCLTIGQDSWTTAGAQLYPDDPVVLEDSQYDHWQTARNVVYATSGPENVVIVHSGSEHSSC